MKIKNRCNTSTTLAIALPLWMLTTGAALAAPPRSGGTTVTHPGPAGNTATRQTHVSTDGHSDYSASSTMTGPAGQTASRQQSGNPATQTYSRSGSTTGPNGATATKTRTVPQTPPSN